MREDSNNSWSSRHSFLPSSATATATATAAAAVGVAESKLGTSSPQAPSSQPPKCVDNDEQVRRARQQRRIRRVRKLSPTQTREVVASTRATRRQTQTPKTRSTSVGEARAKRHLPMMEPNHKCRIVIRRNAIHLRTLWTDSLPDALVIISAAAASNRGEERQRRIASTPPRSGKTVTDRAADDLSGRQRAASTAGAAIPDDGDYRRRISRTP